MADLNILHPKYTKCRMFRFQQQLHLHIKYYKQQLREDRAKHNKIQEEKMYNQS